MSDAPPFSATFQIGKGPNGEIATAWSLSREPNALELALWHSALVTKVHAISDAFRKSEIVQPATPSNGGVVQPMKPRLVVPEGVAPGEPA